MNQDMEKYFVLMKPEELHGTIKPNNKGYGYDTLFLSHFEGKLLNKEYTTFSQNVRCTFQVDKDKIIYIHHKFLEKIKSQLEIGKLYNIRIREDKPHIIDVCVYYSKWDMYIPVGAGLEGVSKTNDRFMVYLYDPQNKIAKSYGNFHKLEYALLFRDYCKHRKWDKVLQTNPSIGLHRSNDLRQMFKEYKNKGELYRELDKYFGFVQPSKTEKYTRIIKRIPLTEQATHKSIYEKAFDNLNIIEENIRKGIVNEDTSLSEYMNTIRAIHIAQQKT